MWPQYLCPCPGHFSYTDDITIPLNFIVTGLHCFEITPGLSTNKQRSVVKDGDTCCTNPSLSNA